MSLVAVLVPAVILPVTNATAAPVGPPGALPPTLVTGPQPSATLAASSAPRQSFTVAYPSIPCSIRTFSVRLSDGTLDTATGCAMEADGVHVWGRYISINGEDRSIEGSWPVIPMSGGTWLALSCAGLENGSCWLGTVDAPELTTGTVSSSGGKQGPIARFGPMSRFMYASGEGVAAQTGSIALASTGRWVALKTRGRDTLSRIDVTTREVLPFAGAPAGNQGFEDRVPLAVDPSGQFIAQGRIDWGGESLTVWDVAPCGPPPATTSGFAAGCASRSVSTLVGDPAFAPARTAELLWREASLSFIATSPSGPLSWLMTAKLPSLSVSADPPTQHVGGAVTLSASGAMSGALVTFEIESGPDVGFRAVVPADAEGAARTTVTGVGVGTDTVTAWVDRDGDGSAGGTEPSGRAFVSWTPPPTPCDGFDAVLLGVRGSGEGDETQSAYDDDFPGRHAREVAAALESTWGLSLYDDDNVDAAGQPRVEDSVVGVTYPGVPAGLRKETLGYGSSVEAGTRALLDQIDRIRGMCGPTFPVLLAGYSQGAHVVQSALERLDDAFQGGATTFRSVAGVALFASPRFDSDDMDARGTFAADHPLDGVAGAARIRPLFQNVTATYCVADDPVCVWSSENIKTADVHSMSYSGAIAADAAGLLAWSVRTRQRGSLGSSPTGEITAFDARKAVRLSAAAIYANGAPTTTFSWDFTSDGVVDRVGPYPVVQHEFGRVKPGEPVKVTMMAAHANGDHTTRTLCVDGSGNVTPGC